jgi:hypothetical protein
MAADRELKSFAALRARAGLRPPPEQETFETLAKPGRDAGGKGSRNEQFNTRVCVWFKGQMEVLKEKERVTVGVLLEAMLQAYQTQGSGIEPGVPPVADVRAGRTKPITFWGSEVMHQAISRIAAEREMTVSELIEEWAAREVQRLDPSGGRFGVYVKR